MPLSNRQLAIAAMDVASSLKLIAQEFGSIKSQLDRLIAHLELQSALNAGTAEGAAPENVIAARREEMAGSRLLQRSDLDYLRETNRAAALRRK